MDWNQTLSNIVIKLQCSSILKKEKLDIFVTENYIKINILDPSEIKFIDFNQAVDPDSLKIVLDGKTIIVTLKKLEATNWEKLEFKGQKKDLQERRKIAEEKRYKELEKLRDTSKKTKSEINDFVITKSIQISDDQRQFLNNKKQLEKQQEVNKLIDFTDNYDEEVPQGKTSIEKDEKNKNELLDLKFISKENNYDERDLSKGNKSLVNNKHNETNIKALPQKESDRTYSKPIVEPKEEIKIRESSTVEINLTKKLIPHYAARESIAKEPPMPKSKILKLKGQKDEIHDEKNPLWIKEKGDNFFNNKDYKSAINVYNKALEIDPEFVKVSINKATCFLCLGELNEAKTELNLIEIKVKSLMENCEKEDEPFYQKLLATCASKLYSIHAMTQDYEESIKNIIYLKKQKHLIHADFLEKIERDEINIVKRKLQSQFFDENKDEFTEIIKEKNWDNYCLLDDIYEKEMISKFDLIISFLKDEVNNKIKDYNNITNDINNNSSIQTQEVTKFNKTDDEIFYDFNLCRIKIIEDSMKKTIDEIIDSNSVKIESSLVELFKFENFNNNNNTKGTCEFLNKFLVYFSLLCNEQYYSNLSLLFTAMKLPRLVIETTSTTIKIINKFKDKITNSITITNIEVKNLIRRALAYETIKDFDKAYEEIIACEKLLLLSKLNESKVEYQSIINEVKERIKGYLLEDKLAQANTLFINKNIADALEIYNECMKLSYLYKNNVTTCKVLINRSSCFVSLAQHDNALNDLNKALYILSKQKAVNILNQKETNEEAILKMKNIEFLCYVKKAAVLNFLKKPKEVVANYELALKIKEDKVIRENLQKVKFNLKSTGE